MKESNESYFFWHFHASADIIVFKLTFKCVYLIIIVPKIKLFLHIDVKLFDAGIFSGERMTRAQHDNVPCVRPSILF